MTAIKNKVRALRAALDTLDCLPESGVEALIKRIDELEQRIIVIAGKEARAKECDVRRAAGEQTFKCGYCKRTRPCQESRDKDGSPRNNG